MSLDLNKEIIEEIRSRCDIADVISGFGVQLKRAGNNSFKGLCPFHQEKTPSFHVDTARQAFHCFGCGKGGDVFRFFMDKENVDFLNAAQILASRCGVVIPEKNDAPHDPRQDGLRDRLFAVNDEFSKFFCRYLADNPHSPGGEYLAKRGIPANVIRQFKIGLAPDSWTACRDFGRSLGFSDDDLLASGVVRKKEDTGNIYDQFKGRVTFTIENEQGRPVGFSARTLEPKPQDGRKYVNTPETPVFHKGSLLYALPQARQGIGKNKYAILCEGQLDAIAFHRAGIPCAVAPLGTAFTPDQARIIRRYTRNLILGFDADGAGRKAVLRAAEIMLPLSVDLRVLKIPGGKDPDELFAHGGSEAMTAAIQNAIPWLDVLHDALPEKFDLSTPVGRSQAAAFVAGFLKLVGNQVELEVYLEQAASMLGVSLEAMKSSLDAAYRAPAAPVSPPPAAIRAETPQQLRDPARTALLTLLGIAMLSVDNARMIAERLADEKLCDADPVVKALNLTINAALNDEFDTLSGELENLLITDPCSEVSQLLVEPLRLSRTDKAVDDSLRDLKRIRQLGSRDELLAMLREETDEQKKWSLLTEYQKLCASTKEVQP